MKTTISVINKTGGVLYTRSTYGNSPKAIVIAAVHTGIFLPSGFVRVS